MSAEENPRLHVLESPRQNQGYSLLRPPAIPPRKHWSSPRQVGHTTNRQRPCRDRDHMVFPDPEGAACRSGSCAISPPGRFDTFGSQPSLASSSRCQAASRRARTSPSETALTLPRTAPTGLARQSLLAAGGHKFNSNPTVGIAYLMRHGLLRSDPDQVARLLHSTVALNAAAIGDYLSNRRDFSQAVLAAYICQAELAGLLLLPALRKLLERLQVPGDGERAARILRCFAEQYCRLNPDMFEQADVPYVCDYAMMLLDIALDGTGVQKPPVHLCDGAESGSPDDARSRDRLVTESTTGRSERTPAAAGGQSDPTRTRNRPYREGWLHKQGGRVKTWKLRWFILQHNCLFYFKNRNDRAALGSVPLENLQLRVVHDPDKNNCFELYVLGGTASGRRNKISAWKKTRVGAGTAAGHHITFRSSADTQLAMRSWMAAIQRSIVLNTLRPPCNTTAPLHPRR